MALELLYDLLLTEDNKYETTIADEVRWEDEGLLVWIPYIWLEEFIEAVNELFEDWGDEYNTTAIMSQEWICINLSKMLESYVDEDELKRVFKEEGEE